jgi:acyl carrier protein
MALDNAVAPEPGAAASGFEAAVLEIVRDVLGHSDVPAEDDVFDHGATSLSFVRILAQVHQRFGVMVRAADLEVASARGIAAGLAARSPLPSVESIGV